MAALSTRASIVAHQAYSLMPLPLTGQTRADFAGWVERAVELGKQEAGELLWDGPRLLGAGDEFERAVSAEVDGQPLVWSERVQVRRSGDLARQQRADLQERLGEAAAAIRAVTPARGRGKRQFTDEAALTAAIAAVERGYRVSGLLAVRGQREEARVTRDVGRGRGSPTRPTRTEATVRSVITAGRPPEEAVVRQQERLGWRVQVTNLPRDQMTLTQAVLH